MLRFRRLKKDIWNFQVRGVIFVILTLSISLLFHWTKSISRYFFVLLQNTISRYRFFCLFCNLLSILEAQRASLRALSALTHTSSCPDDFTLSILTSITSPSDHIFGSAFTLLTRTLSILYCTVLPCATNIFTVTLITFIAVNRRLLLAQWIDVAQKLAVVFSLQKNTLVDVSIQWRQHCKIVLSDYGCTRRDIGLVLCRSALWDCFGTIFLLLLENLWF